jgi:hypothetical protein
VTSPAVSTEIQRVARSNQIVGAAEALDENEGEEHREQSQCQDEGAPVIPRHGANAVYRAGFAFAFASALRHFSRSNRHFS